MKAQVDHVKLHFIVLIWGFTGILGAVISVEALSLVFWRTLITAIAMGCILICLKHSPKIKLQSALILIGIGLIVGLHWISFFTAVKLGGPSLGMVGLSTVSLWVALLGPFFHGKKISKVEILLGIGVVVALAIIADANYSKVEGLAFSVLAAFLAAVFSLLNGKYVHSVNHYVISFYEMMGACLVCFFSLCFYYSSNSIILLPNQMDWIYLGILAILCTAYPYAASIELLKRLSVFVVNLVTNLEPIYGMALAALILGEYESLNVQFYTGALLMCLIVSSYPMLKSRFSD